MSREWGSSSASLLWGVPEREARHPVFGPGLFFTCLWVGCQGRSPGCHADRCTGLSPLAPEREKRDSQDIIDALRAALEERNTAVESLQRALDEAEMLCSTLKVRPGLWGRSVGGGAPALAHHASLTRFRLGQQLGVRCCEMEASPLVPRPPKLYPPSS